MEKRAGLAIFLSLLVLIIFSYYSNKNLPKKEELQKRTARIVQPAPAKSRERIYPTAKTPLAVPHQEFAQPNPSSKRDLSTEIPVETDLYRSILSRDGAILKLGLKNFRREKEIKEGKLFSVVSADAIFYPLQFTDRGKDIFYRADKKSLRLNRENKVGKLTLTGKSKNGLQVTKIFTFNNHNYGVNLTLRVKNFSSREKLVDKIAILCGAGFSSKKKKKNRYNIEEDRISSETGISKFKAGRLKEERRMSETNWVAQKSQYLLLFLKSSSAMNSFIYPQKDKLIAGMQVPAFTIPGKGTVEKKFFFYAGPGEYKIARAEDNGVEKAVEGGIFVTLGRFILTILTFFYRLVGNWGWAIVILTILLKILLFPLSRSSFRSISQMQKLQPYLKDLKTKYKGNTQMMNKEMMELYRKYKINPLGGCLPMLAQMPIFIAFFFMLRNAVVLRGAKFIFWINDLSLPDTVAHLSLGTTHIPINILPILMGASMFVQQKMTTTDPNQKMMAVMMPILFTFMFYNFSSGLLVYWLLTNILSIFEQKLVGKK